jgi:hypothetical protein
MIRHLLLIILLTTFSINTQAQNCSPDCRATLNNYTGKIKANPNDNICITGTFSGTIEMHGGTVHICANAQIQSINYTKYSELFIEKNAIVNIQSLIGNDEVTITNNSDSFVIGQGNFNKSFNFTNSGTCRITSASLNGPLTFYNKGNLYFNSGININAPSIINTDKLIEINGSLNMNSPNITINNTCQMRVKGDMNLNGQTINITAGYLRVDNTLSQNSGVIKLINSSVLYVNGLSVNGYIEGTESRSTVVSNNNPNLNGQGAIRGNIS